MKELIRYVYNKHERHVARWAFGKMEGETRNRVWALLDKGTPIGCVVAIGPNRMGWSRVHGGDVFTKKKARDIAYGRAVKESHLPVPKCLMVAYEEMRELSQKTLWE